MFLKSGRWMFLLNLNYLAEKLDQQVQMPIIKGLAWSKCRNLESNMGNLISTYPIPGKSYWKENYKRLRSRTNFLQILTKSNFLNHVSTLYLHPKMKKNSKNNI